MKEEEHCTLEAITKTLENNIKGLESNDEESKWKVRPLYATKSKDNYASILYVAERPGNESSTGKSQSLIIKVMPDDPHVREFQNSDKQFYNECNVFQNVIPLLMKYSGLNDINSLAYSLFPKCYYTDDDPEKAIIIMENLKSQGYVLADLTLDYMHCKLSLEGLARFHALSYALKHNHNDIFKKKVVDTIKEARYCNKNRERQNFFMGYTSTHPINVILKSEDPKLIEFRNENEMFLKKLGSVFQNTVDLLARLNEPKEPLAVLCHGDYNRNNIMFNYTSNKPTEIKLLDFQTVRYANPSTDIVFIMYMNTTSATRHQHMDDLLLAYQSTLVTCLIEMTDICRDELEQIYSLEAIKADFESHSLLGYVISSMFIHLMMASIEEIIEMQRIESTETDGGVPSLEFLRQWVQLGGAEATQRSVDMIQEMALMKRCLVYSKNLG